MSVPYIFQTAREELYRQISRHANHIIGRVLDVGAGSVERYKHLFKHTDYIKFDKVSHSNDYVKGSADSLPFADDSFDSIVCTQVLGDIYDVQKVFKEFYRVLRRGGTALITEALHDPLHDEPYDYWRFTAHAFRHLAESSGFKIEVLESRGGYHSVMVQFRARYWIERLNLYKHWYGYVIGKFLSIVGRCAMARDRRDPSQANKLFAHGYLLIIKKS
ncbi:MAG: hypothetical protein A3G52_02290 [Candidatus Taylorbacteria bacterium RIFCSPLOWO2_12_FULL_43_20]|uniref:Methyltransferase type 11 domain-containing protein n=1 Tax=Candidatus Taylorbacteria bacterium RIFCSPLOWO2_12_FULL_43_20 TaxID=1802332 RepID=A0A1G2P5L2_9BACT|nr:MAG: hypothetical protein A3E92_02685 [Candidatus Taylorbacteria bacterium RIFCSPHIGHO2_12_FULL_42_34]OHA42922.1 MAG: hypothetical protein A3G52_02290 [Candidatus Taylorbacteria bacterium RIFCSPLOWO2_12_FULL_43_20]